jgi:Transposase, Mutator family
MQSRFSLPADVATVTNMLERLNQEIKGRTHVIRTFPNEESALRLIRALAVEINEDWIEAHRYLNMEMLREQRKQLQPLPPKVNAAASSQIGFLWLSASAGAVSLLSSSLHQPRPAGAFVNKPHPSFQLLPDLLFAELDAHN